MSRTVLATDFVGSDKRGVKSGRDNKALGRKLQLNLLMKCGHMAVIEGYLQIAVFIRRWLDHK